MIRLCKVSYLATILYRRKALTSIPTNALLPYFRLLHRGWDIRYPAVLLDGHIHEGHRRIVTLYRFEPKWMVPVIELYSYEQLSAFLARHAQRHPTSITTP